MNAPRFSTCGATVLHARGARLCKTMLPDGSLRPYDSARLFNLHPVELGDLAALHDLLQHLAQHRDCALVRGAPVDAANRARGVRRLLHGDSETGDLPTLRDVARRWVALDLDGLPLPAGIDMRDLAACAAAVLPRLPAAFQCAGCIVQATASHGIKAGARLRLWYWLARPATGAELAAWLAAAPVDRSVFGAVQPIYTAPPLFLAGEGDPLPTRLMVRPGPVVAVPTAAMLLPTPKQQLPARHQAMDGGLSRLVRFVEGAAEGERSDRLYWAACRAGEMVARRDVARDLAAQHLAAAGQRTGLNEREARATAESGLRTGAGEATHA